MKSGSWNSYQSALPPEARIGGEPDDEPIGSTPETPTKTCATCKHWAEFGRVERWGSCGRIDRAADQGSHGVVLAIVSDGSGDPNDDTATIDTRADFGCVLHEART